MKTKTISIFGCGWLGISLARRFLSEGYAVKGSTTRTEKLPSLRDLGIAPYQISLTPELNGQKAPEFFDTDILIIDIPPQVHKWGEDFHPQQIDSILEAIATKEQLHVLYTSSTSVYPDNGEELTETEATPEAEGANKTLLSAEAKLKEALGSRLSILRFGGLMGYDRISGKWSRGSELEDTPVNYLHRDDAVEVVVQLIAQEKWGEVYNAVAPEHPGRAAIYKKNAAAFGWPEPQVVPAKKKKTISSKKLQQALGYSFIFPDPLEFSYTNPDNS
jgi:nucleoside-diphosphate-sugar epimerase